jgi:hypothetical protein
MVMSLQGRVVEPQGLVRFAYEVSSKVNGASCGVQKIQTIFDDMISRIRHDGQMMGSWLAARNSSSLSTLPQSGDTVALNAEGLASASATGNPSEVERFIERLIVSLHGRVIDRQGLAHFAWMWLSKARQSNCEVEHVRPIFEEMVAHIRDLVTKPLAWAAVGNAASANIAPLNGEGLVAVAATGNPIEFEAFISRIILSCHGSIKNQNGLIRFAITWMKKATATQLTSQSAQSTYDEMVSQLHNDAGLPVAWLSMPLHLASPLVLAPLAQSAGVLSAPLVSSISPPLLQPLASPTPSLTAGCSLSSPSPPPPPPLPLQAPPTSLHQTGFGSLASLPPVLRAP